MTFNTPNVSDILTTLIGNDALISALKENGALITREKLLNEYPQEANFIRRIYPKYRLGGFHVLAKSNDYKTFKETVIKDGYRKNMSRLIFYDDVRLSLYALLFCISLKVFYKVSR